MRYRPFGPFSQSVSAVGVSVDGTGSSPRAMRDMVTTGLEHGVNLYEAAYGDLAAAEAIAQSSQTLDRSLVMVGLRLRAGQRDLSRGALIEGLRAVLARSGLRWIDYLVVDDPRPGELGEDFFDVMDAARKARRLRFVGLSGETEAVDELIRSKRFQLFSSNYNLCSNWSVRNRLKLAQGAQLAIIGHNPAPASVTGLKQRRQAEAAPEKKSSLLGGLFSGRNPVEEELEADTYAFLRHINGWSPENICLAYALTEPSLSGFLVAPTRVEEVEQLAAIPEKEMPNGVPAQIEMARVSLGGV